MRRYETYLLGILSGYSSQSLLCSTTLTISIFRTPSATSLANSTTSAIGLPWPATTAYQMMLLSTTSVQTQPTIFLSYRDSTTLAPPGSQACMQSNMVLRRQSHFPTSKSSATFWMLLQDLIPVEQIPERAEMQSLRSFPAIRHMVWRFRPRRSRMAFTRSCMRCKVKEKRTGQEQRSLRIVAVPCGLLRKHCFLNWLFRCWMKTTLGLAQPLLQ